MMDLFLKSFIFACHVQVIYGSLSNPYRADGDISKVIPEYNDVKTFKAYHNMTPQHLPDIEKMKTSIPSCNIDAHLKWTSIVGSSVYSTPVLFPSGDDEKKQIFLSTFYQYVEVIGYDGFKPWGFPLGFDGSSFQTSPILYDIDGDGVNDVGVIDKNANLYWIRLGEFGQYLEDFHVQVPKLKIRKDWADGMDPAFLDSYVLTSMFDNRYDPKKTEQKVKQDPLQVVVKQDTYPEQNLPPDSSKQSRRLQFARSSESAGEPSSGRGAKHWQGRKLLGEEVPLDDVPPQKQDENMKVLDEVQREKDAIAAHADKVHATGGDDVSQSAEGPGDDVQAAGEAYMPPHWDDPVTAGGDPSEWVDDYTRHFHRHYMGDDMRFNGYGSFGGMYNDSNYVYVDAHVLANPTIADVNNDGNVEIIIPVSYYFDKVEYEGERVVALIIDIRHLMHALLYRAKGGLRAVKLHRRRSGMLEHPRRGVVVAGAPGPDHRQDQVQGAHSQRAHCSRSGRRRQIGGDRGHISGTALCPRWYVLLYQPVMNDDDGGGVAGNTGFSRRYFPMQFHEIQVRRPPLLVFAARSL
jgi:hypothetical protein